MNFDIIRARFGRLSVLQVEGIEAVAASTAGMPRTWRAYILATAWHETGGKMQPVSENMNYTTAGRIRKVWPSRFPTLADAEPFARNPEGLANRVYGGRMGNDRGGDGWKYRGRGHVQITGRENYTTFAKLLKLDLVNKPDLALQPAVSIRILVEGMRAGSFTGEALAMHLPGNYASARRIVNGMDRAEDIAAQARAFEEALPAVSAPIPAAKPSSPWAGLGSALVAMFRKK